MSERQGDERREGVDPLARILGDVRLGAGAWIAPFATLQGPLIAGPRLRVHPQATVGGPAQHRLGDLGSLALGADVVIREGATVHRGSTPGGGVTVLGDRVWLMAGAHLGHDVRVGDGVVLANGALVGGHVEIGACATLGARAAIHQFVRIGTGAMVAAGALVSGDVPPWSLVAGDRARLVGPNEPALRARGGGEAVVRVRRALRWFHRVGAVEAGALEALGPWTMGWDPAAEVFSFLGSPGRRALVPRARPA